MNITPIQRQQLSTLQAQVTTESDRRYLDWLITQGIDRRTTFYPSSALMQRVNAIL